jgi:dolichol-phosphate mannosyltransferase
MTKPDAIPANAPPAPAREAGLTTEDRSAPARRAPELSLVVPTFNERDNVPVLVSRLAAVLDGIDWEVVFVDDDSPDGTSDVVADLARRDPRVRGIRRIGRRGLSSACIEGMLSSSAPYLAIMDADLQHDEAILPAMFEAARGEGLDIVVASRYAAGGTTSDWSEGRARLSRAAVRLGKLASGVTLTDPMSGYFLLRRGVFLEVVRDLSGIGFKILLDIFVSAGRPLTFKEVPYRFRSRQAGESKLDERALWDFGMLLVDKKVGHLVPVRFVAFSAVGALGVLTHMLTLALLHRGIGVAFAASQAAATAVAMTGNFALNNALTYRDMRLRGRGWVRGWVSFVAVCGLGALANVGVASYLQGREARWWLAGLAGVVVGSVWNFAVTSRYTWKR